MAITASAELSATPRLVLYARVSTEDQAERQTVQAQLDFLRNWAALYQFPIVGEYVDDGVSGTIPLADREYGGRLLAELPRLRPTKLVVYRLDRLGRSARVLLDADTVLERAGVTIQSATEPFETSSPIGRFVFQLLGSIAELEKSTITERMALGRDRVARTGRWTGGPIPFGYDLDPEGRLIPSGRLVASTGQTEAEIARSVFERIAAGSSTVVEARRLNALVVPTARRYGSGKTVTVGATWLPSRINAMIRNSLYAGTHVFKSKGGPISREVPALVSRELWERARSQLTRNRALSTRNARRSYLLRGLITCDNCGAHYAGTPHRSGSGGKRLDYYYRCGSQLGVVHPDPSRRCRSKLLSAPWIEDLVWSHCRDFIANPGDALEEAQHLLEARLAQATTHEPQRRAILAQVSQKDAERERVLTLYRRNRITMTEAETQLDAIARERADLQQMADSLGAQVALAEASSAYLTQAADVLIRLRDRVNEVDRTNDWTTKRQVVELLVAGVRVRTEGQGYHKRSTVTIQYRFAEPDAVDPTTNSYACSRRRDSATSGRACPARG
jgi:site-specific DNA recombinase